MSAGVQPRVVDVPAIEHSGSMATNARSPRPEPILDIKDLSIAYRTGSGDV